MRPCAPPAAALIAANATGCLEVFSTPFPESSWRLPWIHSLFANAPAVATGIAAALRAQGRTDIRVVGQGGDGGTVDIGLACLSGMFERGDDVLYICYDNEAYMNTGVQRSAATPPAARTATTEPLGGHPGNAFGQGKNMPLIAMAHEIPYVATATVAELRDLERKVARAMELHGPRYIHVLVPCPLGWGSAPAETIEIARLAKETGLFPVFEAEDGASSRVSPIRRQRPSRTTCARQKRYAHLFADGRQPEIVARCRRCADRNIERFGLLGRRARGGARACSRCSPRRSGGRSERPRPDEPADRPFAITLDVGSSLANHTGAWRTERPQYVRRPAALQRRLPGRRGHAALAVRGRVRRRGLRAGVAGARPGQPVPGRDGPGLLPPLRDGLQPLSSSTRRSGSTRSSASSATRRSATAGSCPRRAPRRDGACWSSARVRAGCRRPTTSRCADTT